MPSQLQQSSLPCWPRPLLLSFCAQDLFFSSLSPSFSPFSLPLPQSYIKFYRPLEEHIKVLGPVKSHKQSAFNIITCHAHTHAHTHTSILFL